MSNVVSIRTRKPVKAEASEVFLSAWEAYPQVGRLRSSKREAWPEWCRVAQEIGEADLAARVRRYAAEDKEHRRECGAPAFHRWLKWGRWEHWAPVAPVLVVPVEFPEPVIRASFHERFSDERARRWLDRCDWDDGAREITNAPPARSEWLAGPFTKWAKANDVRGVVFA